MTDHIVLQIWPLGLFSLLFFGFLFYFDNLIRLLILLEFFMLSNTTLLVVLIFSSERYESYNLLGSVPIFLAAAAADAAVGLGILVVLYRHKKNLDPKEVSNTNG